MGKVFSILDSFTIFVLHKLEQGIYLGPLGLHGIQAFQHVFPDFIYCTSKCCNCIHVFIFRWKCNPRRYPVDLPVLYGQGKMYNYFRSIIFYVTFLISYCPSFDFFLYSRNMSYKQLSRKNERELSGFHVCAVIL